LQEYYKLQRPACGFADTVHCAAAAAAAAAAASSMHHHQLALGSILCESKARELPCGVFGSFGWSGEAVDEMEAKLKDGGYGFAFKPIKVKFKPTATVRLQH
jgi:flavorubredoxin